MVALGTGKDVCHGGANFKHCDERRVSKNYLSGGDGPGG